jgi:hypothetical protein
MVGSGSDEDTEVYLRFYADDGEREGYRDLYPQGLPEKQRRPFDRDRHLPQPPNDTLFSDASPFELDESDE